MAGIIVVSGQITATTADILQGTRLQTVPANGSLSFEMQAADADATNSATVSIQLPDGSTPLNGALVPGNGTAGSAGVIDDRLALKLRFRIGQGGHCVFGITETGTTTVTYRIVFRPF